MSPLKLNAHLAVSDISPALPGREVSFVAEHPFAKTAGRAVNFAASSRLDWASIPSQYPGVTVTGSLSDHLAAAAHSAGGYVKAAGQDLVAGALEMLPMSAPLKALISSADPKYLPDVFKDLKLGQAADNLRQQAAGAYGLVSTSLAKLTDGPLDIDMKAWAHSDRLTGMHLIENGFSLKEPLTSKDQPTPAGALFNVATNLWNGATTQYKNGVHISPETTAALVDAVMPVAAFLTAKRAPVVTRLSGSPVGSVVMEGAGHGQRRYSLAGTKAQLFVRSEVAVVRSAEASRYKIKDVKIALEREVSPNSYRLLEHVLDPKNVGFETSEVVARVAINKSNFELLSGLPQGRALQSIAKGPLADTSLGQTLMAHGIERISSVQMTPPKRRPDGKVVRYAEIVFKR